MSVQNVSLEPLLTRLSCVKQRNPSEWVACCPAHADEKASLGIRFPGNNGGIVLKCYAGCPTEQIVAAVGLTLADLMPPRPDAERNGVGKRLATPQIVATYDYTDEAGTLLYQVVRYAPKDFRQRRRDPKKRDAWVWSLQGVRRVLYRLPSVLKAAQDGGRVYLVEGEKDADRLTDLGVMATTNAGGADKWQASFSESLRGAHVVLIPDNDEPGRKHVHRAGADLQGKAASVRVLELPGLAPKGDVSDWLKSGGTAAELERLADAAPFWVAPPLPAPITLPPASPTAPRTVSGLTADAIPPPHLKGEFAPYQIAALLGFETGAAADTHKAHAERIRHHLGEDLAFCKPLGGWLFYNGKHWVMDGRDAPTLTARAAGLSSIVRDEAAALYDMAGNLARSGRTEDADAMSRAARAHLRHATKTENTGFIHDALEQAAGLLRAEHQRFEPRPWVMGFENGVWDKGTWREHRREDGFLAVSPVSCLPDADRSEWYALLDRLTGGDADFARSLQDLCGYVLSGASTLRTIPWAYGPRGCGKSTFAELLLTVLGEMGKTIDPMQLADDASRERLGASIFGARLVAVAEAGNQRIGAEVLKTLSGSDSFPVRRLYAEAFTARPSHVLLMIANDPPRMDAYDEALRERVMTLPLTHPLTEPAPLTFADGKRIEEVRRNPQSALLSGFLAWAMEGLARVWETQEIHQAQCIREASRRFWQDTDPLAEFWATVDRESLRCGVSKADLRARYDEWCEEQGIRRRYSPREWARACKARGLEEIRTGANSTREWVLIHESRFTDTTDATDAILIKPPAREENCYRGLSENRVGSVGSVGNEDFGPLDTSDLTDPFVDGDGEGSNVW